MSVVRIGDLPALRPCAHVDHETPLGLPLADGVYVHECPACGRRDLFEVRKPDRWAHVVDDPDVIGSPLWVTYAKAYCRRTYRELRRFGVTREHARADLAKVLRRIEDAEAGSVR